MKSNITKNSNITIFSSKTIYWTRIETLGRLVSDGKILTSLTTGLEEHTNYKGMNLYGFSMADQSCLTVMNIDFYSGGQDRFLIN